MAIYRLGTHTPAIDADTYIFDGADIIGDVTLEAGVSVWAGVRIRGDNAHIHIGRGANIQDNSVLHVDEGAPLTIEEDVSIGHQAMLHGCTIRAGALVGIQAVILNHAIVGRHCLIGAGAIIPEGREIPDRSLVVGVGKIVRTLNDEEVRMLHHNAEHYLQRGRLYRQQLERIAP
ncbi:MAG: gamma carbonic anhydrase family protein [Candidimonas sp.]|nr:MAG: gamma carbonic anhydrase family protein [Candidimonas sp.]